MIYFGVYQDDRDNDESSICETQSLDDCVDKIVWYFRTWSQSLEHMKYWKVYDSNGLVHVQQSTIDLS